MVRFWRQIILFAAALFVSNAQVPSTEPTFQPTIQPTIQPTVSIQPSLQPTSLQPTVSFQPSFLPTLTTQPTLTIETEDTDTYTSKTRAEKAKSGLQDVFVYIAIFVVFYLFLKKLLKYAKQTIDKVHPLPKVDEFYKRNGYSFDYTFVFNVLDEQVHTFNAEQSKFTMRVIIERLSNAGLESKYFYSCQRDELYVKVRAEPERLRAEAGRINYKLLLDPDKLRSKAMNGRKRDGKVIWKPIFLVDEFKLSSINPFQYIYAPYDANAFAEGLYKLYPAMNNHKHIFTNLDRIKLIISIIEAHMSCTPHGGGLNIGLLVAKKVVLAAFPLHEYDQLNSLQMQWLNLLAPPWTQPVDDIKEYFGHRIGLYFLYLQHYVTLLMVPAVLGAITFIVQKVYYDPENFLMPWFTGFMVLWSTLYVERWKRRQCTAAMRWGSIGCEDTEQDRPLYDGVRIKSPINGQDITYFPPSAKSRKTTIALSCTVSMILGVIAIVAGIYFFQWWINQPERNEILVLGKVNFTSIIATLMNTVVIVVLNMVYQGVAIKLNDFENHRTDTMYEDYLISKIFTFQLVNTFAGLTYVSFIKTYLGIQCSNGNCTGDVAASLSTVFLSAMVTRAILQIFVRKIQQSMKEKRETSGLPPGVFPSPLEEQYILDEYPIIIGTLTDYAGLVIQFGYTVLFVAAFPLAPTIAFISGFIQIRIDGWKLCQAFRRPQPKTAEDIGVWQGMLEVLGVIGVIYNFGLIFLTGHYLENTTYEYRWIIFIIVEHFTFFLKYVISVVIDDVPEKVKIQLARQEFLVSKVIQNAEDESDDPFVEGKANLNFTIHNFDNDYINEADEESQDTHMSDD